MMCICRYYFQNFHTCLITIFKLIFISLRSTCIQPDSFISMVSRILVAAFGMICVHASAGMICVHTRWIIMVNTNCPHLELIRGLLSSCSFSSAAPLTITFFLRKSTVAGYGKTLRQTSLPACTVAYEQPEEGNCETTDRNGHDDSQIFPIEFRW